MAHGPGGHRHILETTDADLPRGLRARRRACGRGNPDRGPRLLPQDHRRALHGGGPDHRRGTSAPRGPWKVARALKDELTHPADDDRPQLGGDQAEPAVNGCGTPAPSPISGRPAQRSLATTDVARRHCPACPTRPDPSSGHDRSSPAPGTAPTRCCRRGWRLSSSASTPRAGHCGKSPSWSTAPRPPSGVPWTNTGCFGGRRGRGRWQRTGRAK